MMDDYFAMDEAGLTSEDLELRSGRKRRFGAVFLILGFAAAAAALILTINNYKDDYEAGKSALADLHGMEEMLGIDADGDGKIGTVPAEEYYKSHNMGSSGRTAAAQSGAAAGSAGGTDGGRAGASSAAGTENGSARGEAAAQAPIYEVHPEMTMPTVEVDGNTYVGFLHIPAIDRTLPVMDTWSYPNLKIAPNRFVGTAYARDMIICAHNYDRHFGQIKNLQPGDKVTFTDVYGDRFDYEVSEVTILQPTDVEEMKDPDDWDLTLFTCTIGGATRVTVRCVMKGSTEGTWNTAAKADLSEKIAALQRQSETQKQT